jgi:hypothetical protein
MNGRIFRTTLAAQARYVAPFLALAVIAAVAIPMTTVQGIDGASTQFGERTGMVLQQSFVAAFYYPILALCTGCFLAVATWLPDIAGRWVYVLTLPVDRVRLAAMRLAAGAALIVPVAAALWIAGWLAVGMAGLESPVVAYPGALALRFFVAATLAYLLVSPMVLFARRTWLLLGLLVLVLVASSIRISAVPDILDLLFLHELSPLHPLAGQWRLFDV